METHDQGLLAQIRERWEGPTLGDADLATLVMGYIAVVTAATGVVYLLPGDTFALSHSFDVLRRFGGEAFWGPLIWSVGLLGLVATWLEWQASSLERRRLTNLPPERIPARRLGRFVWSLTAVVWSFVGCSLFYSAWVITDAVSPGGVSYACLAILAQIIAATARKRRDAGVGECGRG